MSLFPVCYFTIELQNLKILVIATAIREWWAVSSGPLGLFLSFRRSFIEVKFIIRQVTVPVVLRHWVVDRLSLSMVV